MIKLCYLNEIDMDGGREFVLEDGLRIFVVRKGDSCYGYLNSCPHANLPLNLAPNVFLDIDKQYIQCANHMAMFEINTGACITGPCHGASLQPISLKIENDEIWASDLTG